MSQWADVPFADLLVETKDGEWGEGAETVGHQLCEVVRGTDFAELHSANKVLPLRWIPDNLVDRKRLRPGDILLETAGGTAKQSTGRTALLGERFFEQRVCPTLCSSFVRHLRLDQGRCDPAFLYYLLQALYAAGYMGVFNLQHTGISRFQFTSFKNKTKLSIPPRVTQRKIAAILSAYDDLIANNQRRIALLESMAEEIYREWFVRMRFPEHETTTFEKGLPHGWGVRAVSELLTEQKRPMKRLDLSSVERYVGLEHIPRKSIALNDWGSPEAVESDKLRFAVGDILFGKIRPYLHKVALANFDGACSTDIIVLRPKSSEVRAFGLFTVFSTTFIDFATTASKGTKMPRADWHYLKCLEIRVPSQALLQRFEKTIEPMLAEVGCLLRANQQLSAQRDALLPRLISGKLKVDHLDIQLPPSMRQKVTA